LVVSESGITLIDIKHVMALRQSVDIMHVSEKNMMLECFRLKGQEKHVLTEINQCFTPIMAQVYVVILRYC